MLGTFGNKALGLQRLAQGGFRTLPMVSVDADAVRAGQPIPLDAIRAQLGSTAWLAVRSSSATEDTETTAAAGAFRTELGVAIEGLTDAILRVAESLPLSGGPHGIVIQPMVADAAASGVLFTHPDRYAVALAPGLCAHVVNGHPVEERGFYPSGETWYTRPDDRRNLECLRMNQETGEFRTESAGPSPWTPALHKALLRTYRDLERHFGRPMDAEWTWDGRNLTLLQARPVTADWHHEPWLLDNSNLAESYAGVVQPMTVSVAANLYRTVYQDLLAASGVPRSIIERHAPVFDHLVTSVHGRMYYVMNHWYAMMAFLPGYGRNKVNLERMISAQTKTQPFLPESLSPSLTLRWTYYPIVIHKLLTFKAKRVAFARDVRRGFERLDALNWGQLEAHDVQRIWRELEADWLRRWYLTVENDTALMTLLGWAEKKFGPDKLESYLRMETPSVAQLRTLHRVAQTCVQVPGAAEALKRGDEAEFYSALQPQSHVALALKSYLAEFGGRFPNELKLEQPSPLDSFDLLAQTLLNAAQHPLPEPHRRDERSIPWGIRKLRQFIRQREELRLLRSTAFGWLRRLLLRAGDLAAAQGLLDHRDDVFWLTREEWLETDPTTWRAAVAAQKHAYANYRSEPLPRSFAWLPGEEPPRAKATEGSATMNGHRVVPGRIEGRVLVMPEFQPGPWPEFDILVARHTDPGWSLLLAQSKGLVIEQGGLLSHASIVARELGIPTLVGVDGASLQLRTGDRIVLDATSGTLYPSTHA